MQCTKELSITISEGDTALDQAIYVASTDKIYGVFGGRAYVFNSATGAKELSSLSVCPSTEINSIAYDTVNGLILCGMSGVTRGDFDNFSADNTIYKLNPVTLAVSGAYTMATYFLAANLKNPFTFTRLMVVAPYVFLVVGSLGGDAGPISGLLGINLTNPALFGRVTHLRPDGWSDIAYDSVLGALWWPRCANDEVNAYDINTFLLVDNFSVAASDSIQGICYCNSNNGLYFVAYNPGLVPAYRVYHRDQASTVITTITLGTTRPNATPVNIRFNSVDGLIYVACGIDNTIVVINPATDLMTVKTGFDNPWDVVFTPTKKFAVQRSSAALKEIT